VKQLALILLLVVVALGVTAGVVFGLRDSRILVPAPENEVEGFLDLFAVRRYPQAMTHVSADVRHTTPTDSLAIWHQRLAARLGDFRLESSSRAWMTEVRASASGKFRGRSGETLEVTFPLEREHGVWRIVDLRTLADVAR
jgi:hypothetical protein